MLMYNWKVISISTFSFLFEVCDKVPYLGAMKSDSSRGGKYLSGGALNEIVANKKIV